MPHIYLNQERGIQNSFFVSFLVYTVQFQHVREHKLWAFYPNIMIELPRLKNTGLIIKLELTDIPVLHFTALGPLAPPHPGDQSVSIPPPGLDGIHPLSMNSLKLSLWDQPLSGTHDINAETESSTTCHQGSAPAWPIFKFRSPDVEIRAHRGGV